MTVIQTSGLSKRYKDKWAVDHLDLQVEQGDIYGFIGRNGAGKSTTLKLLCGLARPTQGEALIFGKPVRDSVARRRVGALIEQPGLYPDLSGRENLRLYAGLLGLDSPERQTDEVMEIMGLSPGEKKPVRHYSMGMKQRLGVALALMGGPDLLLLDEPINGLDPIGIAEVRSFIRALCDERGKTILISSHILSEVALLADDIGIIDHGVLLEEESLADLEAKSDRYVRFTVSDTGRAAEVLNSAFHENQFTVQDGHHLRMDSAKVPVAKIVSAFVQYGLEVSEAATVEESLEDYFKRVTGGEGIA